MIGARSISLFGALNKDADEFRLQRTVESFRKTSFLLDMADGSEGD